MRNEFYLNPVVDRQDVLDACRGIAADYVSVFGAVAEARAESRFKIICVTWRQKANWRMVRLLIQRAQEVANA